VQLLLKLVASALRCIACRYRTAKQSYLLFALCNVALLTIMIRAEARKAMQRLISSVDDTVYTNVTSLSLLEHP